MALKRTRASERGSTLLEAMLATAIASMLLLTGLQLAALVSTQRQDRLMVHYLDRLGDAASAYMASPALLAHVSQEELYYPPQQGGLAHGAHIGVIGLTELRQQGLLHPDFPELPLFGSTPKLDLRIHHEEDGARLVQGVMFFSKSGLARHRVRRVIAHARHVVGHIEQAGGVLHTRLNSGASLRGAALEKLVGARFTSHAGALVALHEAPLPPVIIIRSLTNILSEAIEEHISGHEKALNQRIAAFAFNEANAERDLSLRQVEVVENIGTMTAYEVPKHVCPAGFEPVAQIYPDTASDADIIAERRFWRGSPVASTIRNRNGRIQRESQPRWWKAVGIFRWYDNNSNLVTNAPVNYSQLRGMMGDMREGTWERVVLFNAAVEFQQSSYFEDLGSAWRFTRLPVYMGEKMDALAQYRTGRLPAGNRCAIYVDCVALSTEKSWMLDARSGYIFGYPSDTPEGACSLVMYHRVGLDYEIDNVALCRHLPPEEVRVIRKCVPNTEFLYRGVDLKLVPPPS